MCVGGTCLDRGGAHRLGLAPVQTWIDSRPRRLRPCPRPADPGISARGGGGGGERVKEIEKGRERERKGGSLREMEREGEREWDR